jgi:hypothetical protein
VPSGEQELFPDSGMFLSSFHLAAIHQASRQHFLHLFHILFDCFFSVEECVNSFAFGRHGKIPERKRVLDWKKVSGILSKYFLKAGLLCYLTAYSKLGLILDEKDLRMLYANLSLQSSQIKFLKTVS